MAVLETVLDDKRMKDRNAGFRGLSSRKLFPKRKPSGTAKQVKRQVRITAKKILRHLSPGNRNTMKGAKEKVEEYDIADEKQGETQMLNRMMLLEQVEGLERENR